MSITSFAELGLRPELLRAVEEAGYTTPTPIQVQAIPVILAGKDVMGGAQTGTGKTAGFALPILQKLAPLANTNHSPARHPVRALILTPTRELAVQVEESFRTYGKYTNLRSTVVYGGVDIKLQLPIVRGGVEILVATPGRLLDHIEHKSVYLGQVEVFVLDEADRMLDMGFIPDIKRIMALLPVTAKRQNLLFSATFSGEIKKLADQLLNAPQLIEVAKRNTAAAHRLAICLQGARRSQARAARASRTLAQPDPGAVLHAHQAWHLAPRAPAREGRARSSTRSMATRASRRGWKRSRRSRKASCRCWSPPTSPRAASTSTTFRSSSISSCPTFPRTTFTASVARAAPAPPARRFRSWRPKRRNTLPTSSGC